jgi:hypothetical protein
VSPLQVEALSTAEIALAVQFLSVQSPATLTDNGLQSAATILKAPVVKLTIDQADVQRVTRRAQSRIKAVIATNDKTRWQDAGYALLPLLALFALMWSRRGWLVR